MIVRSEPVLRPFGKPIRRLLDRQQSLNFNNIMKKLFHGLFTKRKKATQDQSNPASTPWRSDAKKLTIFFSSIWSFMRLAESMSPIDLHNHLNCYLTAMIRVIEENGGSVNRIWADNIMCLWGQDNQATLACRCALHQMEVLNRLNEQWPAGKRIRLRVGISTGCALNVPRGKQQQDFSTTADSVALAARLEGTNKMYSTNILISESTYELVKEQVLSRELDAIRVKGKNRAVLIYELIDMIDRSTMLSYEAIDKNVEAEKHSQLRSGLLLEEIKLTVMFANLAGSLTLSGTLTQQEVLNQLNLYLTAMTDIVFDHKGDVDKLIGDEIMCFWSTQEEHAFEACKCALAMVKALDRLNRNWRTKLRVQIGINSGVASMGGVGRPNLMDYSVVGDDVNIASRLAQTNRAYDTRIIIGEKTHLLVKKHVKENALGEIHIGGRVHATKIYELVEVLKPLST